MKRRLSELYEKKPKAFAVILCAGMTALAFLIYSLSYLLPYALRAYDATPGGLYTLTAVTEEIAGALDTDVELIYVSDGVPGSAAVEHILDRYASLSDKLTVERRSLSDASEYGDLTDGSVVVTSKKRTVTVKPCELLDISAEYYSKNYYYYSSFLQSGYITCSFYEFMEQYGEYLGLYDLARYEERLTSAVRYVSVEEPITVYALTDHGEMALSTVITSELAVSLTEIIYGTLEQGIPQEADAVLISAPTSDITASELGLLREYLAGGGKLALVTSYASVGKLTELLSLCAEYGMTTDGGLVCEDDASRNLEGYVALTYPTVSAESYGSSSASLPDSVMYTSGTGISFTELEGISVKSLLDTSDTAYTKRGAEELETLSFNEETDTRGRYSVGALSTATASGGQLLWLPSTAYITEEYDVGSLGDNFAVLKASLELLLGASTPEIAPVSLLTEALDPPAQALYTAVAITALLPCLTVVIGMIITVKRRSWTSRTHSSPMNACAKK